MLPNCKSSSIRKAILIYLRTPFAIAIRNLPIAANSLTITVWAETITNPINYMIEQNKNHTNAPIRKKVHFLINPLLIELIFNLQRNPVMSIRKRKFYIFVLIVSVSVYARSVLFTV